MPDCKSVENLKMEVKKFGKIRRFKRTPKLSSEDCIKKLKDEIISLQNDKQKFGRLLVVIVVVFCFFVCNVHWKQKLEIEQEKGRGLQEQLEMTQEQVELWQKKYESTEYMIRESQNEQLECQKYNIYNIVQTAAGILRGVAKPFLMLT